MDAARAPSAPADSAPQGFIRREVYRTHRPTGLLARTWNTRGIDLIAVPGLWGFLLLPFYAR